MLEEKISKHLGVPYIYIPSKRIFLCENGVPFTKEEYKDIDINAEYEKRKESDELYDYIYAKNTGILRKKRGYAKAKEVAKDINGKNMETKNTTEEIKEASTTNARIQNKVYVDRRTADRLTKNKLETAILLLCFGLTIVSFGSMWISTLHTATYLLDYFATASAWIMSSIITLYASTAFEVVQLFWDRRKYFLSVVFFTLWALVVVFSMVTTVSVFYERFNFNKMQNTETNKEVDSNRLTLEILKNDEQYLLEEIQFKKEDIEWRRSMDYATNARTLELIDLQEKLQANREEQKAIMLSTPDAVKEEAEVVKKETFFDFLSRVTGVDSGVIEFIMSILSAIFINLIAPFTLSTVVTLTSGSKNDKGSSN